MRASVGLVALALIACRSDDAPPPTVPVVPPPAPDASPPAPAPPPPAAPPAQATVRVLLDAVTATTPRSPRLGAPDVERVVGARIGAIRRCYQAATARDPSLHGRLVVALAVDAAGAATALVQPAFSVDVDPCVVAALARVQLPVPGGSGAGFTLAFVLTS